MQLTKVIEHLQGIAPEHLAEPWDKVGLQLGDPRWDVRRSLLCIDLTKAVLAEAIRMRAGLIVAYHPPIFEPLTALTSRDPKQALILALATRKIAIYSPHTALDAAAGGLNDWLLGAAGDQASGCVRAIRPAAVGATDDGPDGGYKIVTFIPATDVDLLRTALAKAGAGVIGAYTQCSYSSAGEGTFHGGAAAKPAIGKAGSLERVAEVRLEMFCPAKRVAQVVAALRSVHPYEEPVFDLYPLRPAPPRAVNPRSQVIGQGRVIDLKKPLSHGALLQRIKRRLGVRQLEVAWPEGLKRVTSLGVCAGAGGSLLRDAGSIDAFLTGEMRHHDVLAARERGVAVILAGHTQTERPYLPHYRKRIERAVGPGVTWVVSRADRVPSGIR